MRAIIANAGLASLHMYMRISGQSPNICGHGCALQAHSLLGVHYHSTYHCYKRITR